MVWNYVNNRPYGKYRELTISPDSFKAEVEKWIKEMKEIGCLDASGEKNIRSSLQSVGYDLHQFMLSHSYNLITNNRLRDYFLVYNCLANSPSASMIQINTDEYKTMGDVNILAKSNDLRWGNQNKVSESDVYCRLYFCESLQDVLDIFVDGLGDVKSLYDYLMQRDENKALEAILYIYNAENKYIKETTGKSCQTCPHSVKEEIVSIIKEDFLNGMGEGFFDEKNYKKALFAWNLCIPEIKQEFIKDESTLRMLKRILQETIK